MFQIVIYIFRRHIFVQTQRRCSSGHIDATKFTSNLYDDHRAVKALFCDQMMKCMLFCVSYIFTFSKKCKDFVVGKDIIPQVTKEEAFAIRFWQKSVGFLLAVGSLHESIASRPVLSWQMVPPRRLVTLTEAKNDGNIKLKSLILIYLMSQDVQFKCVGGRKIESKNIWVPNDDI